MTLSDIEQIDTEFLPISVVAEYLGMSHQPQPLRESIRKGVPWAYVIGRAKFVIPKQAFISWHKHGGIINV